MRKTFTIQQSREADCFQRLEREVERMLRGEFGDWNLYEDAKPKVERALILYLNIIMKDGRTPNKSIKFKNTDWSLGYVMRRFGIII